MYGFVFLFTSLITSSLSFASELSCNQEITREPYCVEIATAKEYCAKMGKNPDTLLKSKKCYVDTADIIITPNGARLTCFTKPVRSSDESLNKSNCGKSSQATSVRGPQGAQ